LRTTVSSTEATIENTIIMRHPNDPPTGRISVLRPIRMRAPYPQSTTATPARLPGRLPSLDGRKGDAERRSLGSAAVSDQPSNAASRFVRGTSTGFTESGMPSEAAVRAGLTDDFSHEDRKRGVRFPDGDADSYPLILRSIWQTTADGRPQIEAETVAVRGERFAAIRIQVDYGNGMLSGSIHVFGLDETLSKLQRDVDFDLDDVDNAIAELDRLQSLAHGS
jgi:hypothetical protein